MTTWLIYFMDIFFQVKTLYRNCKFCLIRECQIVKERKQLVEADNSLSPGKKHGVLKTSYFLLFRAVRICLRASVTSLRFVCLSLQKERVACYRLTTRGRQRAGQTSFRIFQLTAPMQGSTRLMFPLCSRQPRRPFSFDSRRARTMA